MSRATAPVLIAGGLLLLPAALAAAAVVVDSIGVKPNPARFSGATAPQVEVGVAVRDRGVTRILGCDLMLDFGDGSAPMPLNFMDGGARKMSVKHVYNKPGTYVVIARGRTGGGPGATGRACESERRVTVAVIGDAPRPAEAAPATSKTCPPGWTLVPGSQVGDKFKCHPLPPSTKIECAGGTKYFEQDGIIGCQ